MIRRVGGAQNRGSPSTIHAIMRSLPRINSPRQPIFLHEYQSDTLKRHDYIPTVDYRTTQIFVVFDGETQRRFSSVEIVLYCDKDVSMDIWQKWVCFLLGECSDGMLTYYYTLTLHTGRPFDNRSLSLSPIAPEIFASTTCLTMILLSHSSQLHSKSSFVIIIIIHVVSSLHPQMTDCAVWRATLSAFFSKANTR